MLKKMLFIIMLALQAAVITSTMATPVSAESPWPDCLPCPVNVQLPF